MMVRGLDWHETGEATVRRGVLDLLARVSGAIEGRGGGGGGGRRGRGRGSGRRGGGKGGGGSGGGGGGAGSGSGEGGSKKCPIGVVKRRYRRRPRTFPVAKRVSLKRHGATRVSPGNTSPTVRVSFHADALTSRVCVLPTIIILRSAGQMTSSIKGKRFSGLPSAQDSHRLARTTDK